jgi:uncharacterized protein YndB with AHSA1/START domain
MERTTERVSVEREIAIAASPETVWEFLVDPDKATRWMGQAASFDPRPGGLYRIDVIPGHTAQGEFVELDPPRRLVHTWGWEPGEDGPNEVPSGSSTVEIELVPDGDGTIPPVHAPRPAEPGSSRLARARLGSLPRAARDRRSRRRPRARPVGERADVGTPAYWVAVAARAAALSPRSRRSST